MTQARDFERLLHIKDFSLRAVEYASGRLREELDTDEVLALALLRLLELIGEAARNVSPALRKQHPEVPWVEIIGTRDRLAHGYTQVNYNVVWTIITKDLSPLIVQVEEIIRNEFKDAHP